LGIAVSDYFSQWLAPTGVGAGATAAIEYFDCSYFASVFAGLSYSFSNGAWGKPWHCDRASPVAIFVGAGGSGTVFDSPDFEAG
jgi:hypothetical protein